MMNAYQNRRLNELIDKLIEHNITKPEYMEYKYLWELLRVESMNINAVGRTSDSHQNITA